MTTYHGADGAARSSVNLACPAAGSVFCSVYAEQSPIWATWCDGVSVTLSPDRDRVTAADVAFARNLVTESLRYLEACERIHADQCTDERPSAA